ncbi:hypothetical protein OROMI_002286 [Orobanche minor]
MDLFVLIEAYASMHLEAYVMPRPPKMPQAHLAPSKTLSRRFFPFLLEY